MNIKRAFLASIYTYFAALVIGVIAAFIFQNDLSQTGISTPMFLVGILAPVVCIWIFATWYFRGHVAQGRIQGLLLGLFVVLISFILDILTVLPTAGGNLDNTVVLLTDYYTQIVFWVTTLIVIGVCVAIGGNIRSKHIKE